MSMRLSLFKKKPPAPKTAPAPQAAPVALAVPIRINLLPHREAARERRRREFLSMLAVVSAAGATAVFAGGMAISQQIDNQASRNRFIQSENEKLDKEIAQIRTLREEIAALKARQQAVENLQSDRTVPVHLFDELVRLAPEGLYLKLLKQDDRKVTLVGHAQTNERVAELLRNLSERSPWLERPELSEIKEVPLRDAVPTAAANPKDKEVRKVYEFSLNALIKRPSASANADKRGARQTTSTEPVKLGSAQ